MEVDSTAQKLDIYLFDATAVFLLTHTNTHTRTSSLMSGVLQLDSLSG